MPLAMLELVMKYMIGTSTMSPWQMTCPPSHSGDLNPPTTPAPHLLMGRHNLDPAWNQLIVMQQKVATTNPWHPKIRLLVMTLELTVPLCNK